MTVVEPEMELQVAVAKAGKYATRESGDTLEMIERPHGGLSFVLADGQTSARGTRLPVHSLSGQGSG